MNTERLMEMMSVHLGEKTNEGSGVLLYLDKFIDT